MGNSTIDVCLRALKNKRETKTDTNTFALDQSVPLFDSVEKKALGSKQPRRRRQ